MTYAGFLLRFLLPPLVVLAALTAWDLRRGVPMPVGLRGRAPWVVLCAHVLTALLYTTPWDNFLVATRVWWYHPQRVIGWVLGWVPVEEYAFFVLQTALAGLWLIWLARRAPTTTSMVADQRQLRRVAFIGVGLAWCAAVVIWLSRWDPATYLSLEFAWALLPILLQVAFGADILWHHRRLLAAAILVPTLYLAMADSTAVGAGTWVFNPQQSSGWQVGGVLPVEELFFFLLTNSLIGFGMVLVMADESQHRVRALLTGIPWVSAPGRST